MGVAVTVVEALGRLLPQYDKEVSDVVARNLKKLGVEVLLNCHASGLASGGTALQVEQAGSTMELPADKALVTVGHRARLDGWGLSELGLVMDGSFVRVDVRCRTSMTDVYAIGDVTGEPMLAHRAMAQGEVVVEVIAGRRLAFEPAAIPAICFTDPEIVSVGFDPERGRDAGHDIKVGKFPLAANGRAMTFGSSVGFVRVVARKDNDLVLGIQAVGKDVSEFASAFALSLEMGARLQDIAGTIHVHPTQGEGVLEAAHLALGHGLHL